MATIWTNISEASGTPWAGVSEAQGTPWTDISKASGSLWSDISKPEPISSIITEVSSGGEPIGLLLALTYSTIVITSVVTQKWSSVAGFTTPWTDIPKAT